MISDNVTHFPLNVILCGPGKSPQFEFKALTDVNKQK